MNANTILDSLLELNEQTSQNYDQVIYDSNNKLNGGRTKNFIICSSRFFVDCFREIRDNRDCSYVTYLNDVVKSGYNPKYVSCLEKNGNNNSIREVLACRIMNYFGVATTFETLAKRENKLKVLSIDFNYKDFEYYSFNDIEINFNLSLEAVIDRIRQKLNLFYISSKFPISKLNESEFHHKTLKFIEDFVMTYLVRKLLLGDRDFFGHNIDISVNKQTGDFLLGPNYDYEYTFNPDDLTFETTEDLIKYVIADYPEVFEIFIQKLLQLMSASLQHRGNLICDDLLDNVFKFKSSKLSKLKDNLLRRYEEICEVMEMNF